MRFLGSRFVAGATLAIALSCVPRAIRVCCGQSGAVGSSNSSPSASAQDAQFLADLAKDSNFEISSSRLALEKTDSGDVKQYARMVIRDHKSLMQQIRAAEKAIGAYPAPPKQMTREDQKMLQQLESLSGDAFEQAYIKQLVQGNDHIQQEEESESAQSAVPAVRALAQRSLAVDQKHAQSAKSLATVRHVQT
jgi:putative membrane protein